MSDERDWNTWMEALDEVRPVPDDVKRRIRQRALSGDVRSAEGGTKGQPRAEFVPLENLPTEDGDFAPIDLRPDIPEKNRPTKPIAIAVGVAAALAVAVLLWLGSFSEPTSNVAATPFPNRSSEVACDELRRASDDLALLETNGPVPLTVEQLAALRLALADFVDELESVGIANEDTASRWRRLDAELRQAGLFEGGGNSDAATALLEGVREQVFNLVWNSENTVVETCFDGWRR